MEFGIDKKELTPTLNTTLLDILQTQTLCTFYLSTIKNITIYITIRQESQIDNKLTIIIIMLLHNIIWMTLADKSNVQCVIIILKRASIF